MTQYYAVMKTTYRLNESGEENPVTQPVAVLKVDGAWNPTEALKLAAEQLGLDRRRLCAYGVPDFDAPCFKPVTPYYGRKPLTDADLERFQVRDDEPAPDAETEETEETQVIIIQ